MRNRHSDNHMDITWQKTATQPPERILKCPHQSNILVCPACTELMPDQFWRRMIRSRFVPEPDTYHVSTLTNCLARGYFDRTIADAEEDMESAWAKLRGSLLHYATRSMGWSELPLQMKFDLDGVTITIVGHLDAYDPETATIYELKTSRFVKWQAEKGFLPRENHIAQVQCYFTLLESYGIPVSRLVLIYADDRNIIPRQVALGRRREWMIQRATLLHRALTRAELPTPEAGEMCR